MQCEPVYCGHPIETGNIASVPGQFGEEYGLVSIAWVIVRMRLFMLGNTRSFSWSLAVSLYMPSNCIGQEGTLVRSRKRPFIYLYDGRDGI